MGGRGTMSSTTTREASGVVYRAAPGAESRGEPMVEVSIAKLDAAWQNDSMYVGANEGEGKKQRFREFLKTGEPVIAPEIAITGRNSVGFDNGRHRFAALREMGKRTVMVTVEKSQERTVRRKFGV